MGLKQKIELAWAAGFYDGEGSSKKINYHYKTKKGLVRKPSQNICMSVSQTDLKVLKRFKKAVNDIGHINGPYQYKANKRPYWIWAASCASAKAAFKLLKPYLCEVKKKQFRIVSKELFTVSTRKKGWTDNEK
jgi:hypothetical protein